MKHRSPEKYRIEWLWALFPAFVGVIIVALLAGFRIIEFEFSIHDVDTFIILCGLLVTVGSSSVLISREAMKQFQRHSDQKAFETFTEERARFLRRLDHEIKNPLMGIRMALDNLAETADPDQRQQIRSAVDEQIDRLNRLISDLRKIGELDNRKIEQLGVEAVTLLQDVFHFAAEHEQAPKRRLHMEVPDSLPPVRGDYDLLFLAIYNVMNNAIKYSRDGDEICLRAAGTKEALHISISDTGPGIAAEELPYVWDELYRAAHSEAIGGSGIGLALVKRIIERHGGTVSIESQVDIGTTMTLTLPSDVTN